ncbi:MAG: UPF0182 family protein, partial [Actinomycetota bacterium]|nr:UPF0182 family protein [Actinomycetota bacterium]
MGDLVRRRLGSVLVGSLLLLVFGANRIAVFVSDLWWFEERGYRDVFLTVLLTRYGIGATFTAALAIFIAVNLSIARRTRPFIIPTTPQQAQVQRVRDAVDPYLPWVIAAVSILFALTSGAAVGARWRTFLLFLNGEGVGIVDPLFDRDLGFWLFELPFWALIQSWLFTSLVLTIMLTAGAHYVLGAIRPESPEKVTPPAKLHLTVLVALALGIRAWGYWLDRYELNFSQRGTVTGASFTDVNAELPALLLLIGVSIIAIVILFASLRRNGFLLPGAALGLLVVASIVLQGVYPAFVQRVRVDPQELAREREFIGRNLEA